MKTPHPVIFPFYFLSLTKKVNLNTLTDSHELAAHKGSLWLASKGLSKLIFS